MKKTLKLILPLLALFAVCTFFSGCEELLTSPEYMKVVMEGDGFSGSETVDVQICKAKIVDGEYFCSDNVVVTGKNLGNDKTYRIEDYVTGTFCYGVRVKLPGESEYTVLKEGKDGTLECSLAMNKDWYLLIHIYKEGGSYKGYYTWKAR